MMGVRASGGLGRVNTMECFVLRFVRCDGSETELFLVIFAR